ncbi:hypothetical protein BD410DRAFT_794056 [Rickenella mellea]|uniref:Zn(2)-C6 fungal-type domain-containing protein n=1 Tax=Rickenella mellea TaxID=50990 RepID=A0A4Y7PRP0_9AGAM|nr:hypothetical protein BD410DRAFT_794056 [Rickenella mellea]
MFSELSGPPHVMKGNLLDLEFTMDMDHRKRRRNRTTQSCLNCHTSKRKCDRKRPCQRCIQLGLTGLCVYEVDDPNLRDDPGLDETTKLRNRIAELESLVRELRGKPHPRWADPNYYDGDAGDKWHTRSQKRNQPAKRRRQTPDFGDDNIPSTVAVKVEPISEIQQPCYYRLSPSPPPPPSYTNFGPASSFSPSRIAYDQVDSDSPVSYSPASPTSSGPGYASCGDPGSSGSHNGSGIYSFPEQTHGKPFSRQLSGEATYDGYHHYDESHAGSSCTCLANPATGHSFVGIARQLQGAVNLLQHLPEHSQTSNCGVYKRILELNDILHGGNLPKSNSSYGGFEPQPDQLRSPADSDLMTPLSVTHAAPLSTPTTPHTLQNMQHWEPPHHSGGFNPYFPQVSAVPDSYEKAVVYDVVA